MGSNERIGTVLLVVATVLVAGSILTEGAVSRGLNGLAGLTWFAAAFLLCRAALATSRAWRLWAVVVGLTALVSVVVRPADFVPAVVGFAVAGVLIGLAAGGREVLWAKVIVGLYLPLHIGSALLRVTWRGLTGGEASVRTEPPPTAALVPLAMLLAAIAGGWLAMALRNRQGRDAGSRIGQPQAR